jgi:hypothetical protein
LVFFVACFPGAARNGGCLLVSFDFHLVELDIIDVRYFVERRRRSGRFMTGPQLAQTSVQLFIVLNVVLRAVTR